MDLVRGNIWTKARSRASTSSQWFRLIYAAVSLLATAG
jgi:hypothetical protein